MPNTDTLYPASAAFDTGTLPVSHGHSLRYAQYGNPKGKPALFLHGGPGAGFTENDHRYFDPTSWRIVLFDQRGAGRSTPHAETRDNTTSLLISDIEVLRSKLDIRSWVVLGGSWGSALALRYAETNPQCIDALVLHGIFLVRQLEFDWFYRDGTPLAFPEAARNFLEWLSEEEKINPIKAYYERIHSNDAEVRRNALKAWARWEAETSSLYRDAGRVERFSNASYAEAFAGIELHYFINGGFLDYDGQLLEDAYKIADIPGTIVHGRYDMVCPIRNAIDLAERWPRAELVIVPDAGHEASEPGIQQALIKATDHFKKRTGAS